MKLSQTACQLQICKDKGSIINSLHASSDCCRLLKIFANSLYPDQDRQNVGLDLDPSCLTLRVFLKEFFEKIIFEKSQQMTTKA